MIGPPRPVPWEYRDLPTCAHCGGQDCKWYPEETELGFRRAGGYYECQDCGCTEMEGEE